jgi:hypothetical protein
MGFYICQIVILAETATDLTQEDYVSPQAITGRYQQLSHERSAQLMGAVSATRQP